jgi:hypothetical protein
MRRLLRLSQSASTTTRLLKLGIYLAVAAALVIATERATRVASAQLDRTGVASPLIELMFWIVCGPGNVLWIIKAFLSGGLHEGWGGPPTLFEQVIWWTGNVVFWALVFLLIERLWRRVHDRLRREPRGAQSDRSGDVR